MKTNFSFFIFIFKFKIIRTTRLWWTISFSFRLIRLFVISKTKKKEVYIYICAFWATVFVLEKWKYFSHWNVKRVKHKKNTVNIFAFKIITIYYWTLWVLLFLIDLCVIYITKKIMIINFIVYSNSLYPPPPPPASDKPFTFDTMYNKIFIVFFHRYSYLIT